MECTQEEFTCIMDIGEQMLISGAEVHRVEDSVRRMCLACRAVRADVFIITSIMIATVYTADSRFFTQTRRIESISVDFERVHRLNQLSRDICTGCLAADQMRTRLEEAVQSPVLSWPLECLCCAVIAGSFTVFFGGGLRDMVVSFCIGALVRTVSFAVEQVLSNRIFRKFLSAILASGLSLLSCSTGWISSADPIIIGNIMTLIPGIGLTNALRDLFTGDSIAGILGITETVLTALAIAAGYFLVHFLGGVGV